MISLRVLKQAIQHQLLQVRQGQGDLSYAELRTTLDSVGRAMIAEDILPDIDLSGVYDHILRDFQIFGPLVDLVHDETINEIVVNGHDTVFVERFGHVERVDGGLADDAALRSVVESLLSINPSARVDLSSPMEDLVTPDGTRINMVVPPVVLGGPHLTIRKLMGSFSSLDDLVDNGTLDLSMAKLLHACVQGRIDLLISGGAGTGKTTLAEQLTQSIPEDERVVVIEDMPELVVHHDNVVRLVAKPMNLEGRGAVTIGHLFRNALHMSPDRILLGEIRGQEAFDYLQALSSGHDGSVGIVHANSPTDALVRLESLVPLADKNVSRASIRRQLAHSLQVIVQMSRMRDGSRKVTRITEVVGLDKDGDVDLNDLFEYRVEGMHEGRVVGRFRAEGSLPTFLHRLKTSGVALDLDVFTESAQDD